MTLFLNSSNKGFLISFFFSLSMTFLCVLLHLVFPFHWPLSVFLFSVFSLPVSLLCLCSFAMLMLGKWEVATHTDTCTASVLIIWKRTASSLGPSGTLQFNPRKKEMNALRALIKLVQVQIKNAMFLPMTEKEIEKERQIYLEIIEAAVFPHWSHWYISKDWVWSLGFYINYCLYLNYFLIKEALNWSKMMWKVKNNYYFK